MTTPHSPRPDSDTSTDAPEQASAAEPGQAAAADDPPEKLDKQTWATLIMFAAFVVFTSGCMINLLTR